MGVMGVAPDEPGILSAIPPRACGGNVDCKELVAGSTLFLPVAVDGALWRPAPTTRLTTTSASFRFHTRPSMKRC